MAMAMTMYDTNEVRYFVILVTSERSNSRIMKFVQPITGFAHSSFKMAITKKTPLVGYFMNMSLHSNLEMEFLTMASLVRVYKESYDEEI